MYGNLKYICKPEVDVGGGVVLNVGLDGDGDVCVVVDVGGIVTVKYHHQDSVG